MSYFNVPGFIKIFFPKQNVQTKYQSVHEIPIMTIDKQIAYIPKTSAEEQNIIFLHTKKLSGYEDLLAKFIELKKKNYNVFLIPEQSPYETFAQLKQNTPKGLTLLGKMVLNGEKQHPLIKFLKCNCDSLYDFKMLGANPITQEVGAFVKSTKNRIKYLKKREFEDFINKQLGISAPLPVSITKLHQKQAK